MKKTVTKVITNRKGESYDIIVDEEHAYLFDKHSYHMKLEKHTNYVQRSVRHPVSGLKSTVYLHNVFQATAFIDGKRTNLGTRPTRIEAARLHDAAVEAEDGNGARSNRAHPRNKELYDRLTEEERQGVADVSF
jgi:hypothetical protein